MEQPRYAEVLAFSSKAGRKAFDPADLPAVQQRNSFVLPGTDTLVRLPAGTVRRFTVTVYLYCGGRLQDAELEILQVRRNGREQWFIDYLGNVDLLG